MEHVVDLPLPPLLFVKHIVFVSAMKVSVSAGTVRNVRTPAAELLLSSYYKRFMPSFQGSVLFLDRKKTGMLYFLAVKKEVAMAQKSDIEIAQSTPMLPITEIAEKLGIPSDRLEQYGNYKAKIDYNLLKEDPRPDGKLILVTAINPTPAGEGKTTTSVGLADGLSRLGKNGPLWGRFSASRAVLRAADTPRLFPWRISTSILPVTFMPSARQTIFWLP